MEDKKQAYVIGVDGGGTKTIAGLANLKGKILKTAKSGPSSPRNVGIKKSAINVAKSIKQVLKAEKEVRIISTFIGLPAVAEEFKPKKDRIKRELKKRIPTIFERKVKVGSDQEVAFRSGSDQKDGILIIAGTGSVVRGWRGKKQVRSSGWGWLTDEGSAFFIGQKALQAIFKDLDGRGPKTLLRRLAFRKFNLKKEEDLINFIYSKNPTESTPLLSVICEKASERGDKVAKDIMTQVAQELVLAVAPIVKKLNFKNLEFPLVLVGGVFNSKTVLNKVKKDLKKIAPKARVILPKEKPVNGAVKLAIENIS
jgi:N-acetylglucosamine kinase-like BadF-type ATPase